MLDVNHAVATLSKSESGIADVHLRGHWADAVERCKMPIRSCWQSVKECTIQSHESGLFFLILRVPGLARWQAKDSGGCFFTRWLSMTGYCVLQ